MISLPMDVAAQKHHLPNQIGIRTLRDDTIEYETHHDRLE